MNSELVAFARQRIKDGLAECTDKNRELFRKMYSHEHVFLPINDVVDNMPEDKLDWAMQQVANTVKKR